jgi:hypothetical protein
MTFFIVTAVKTTNLTNRNMFRTFGFYNRPVLLHSALPSYRISQYGHNFKIGWYRNNILDLYFWRSTV